MHKKIIKHLKQGTLLKAILNKLFKPITKPITKLYELNLILKGKIISNPDEVVYVLTDSIEEYAVDIAPTGKKLQRYYNIGFIRQRIVGWIENGNWDNNTKRYDDQPHFSIFKERFVEGKEWEETGYHKWFHELLRNEGTVRGCMNWAEFKEKFMRVWDDIYNHTIKNGYNVNRILMPRDNIQVVVSRQGKILFNDGRHRLSIAKILNLKEVPVIVNYWHKEFIDEVKRRIGEKKITPSKAIKFSIEKYKACSK